MAPALVKSDAGSPLQFKVSYRGKLLEVHRSSSDTLNTVATYLGDVTGASPETIKLIPPKSKRASPGKHAHTAMHLRNPEWANLTLEEAGFVQGMTVLMSGASATEVAAVSKPSATGVADFDYEERRARARARRKRTPLPLPTGPYVFADFKTLQLPGIVLYPPEAKALKLMHRLASDPGVVAIMNKYKWRVGIMTELAPEGYVGVSPVCLLGFNRNRGAEISLRLRTDDLAGFRKYDSIRKTLLHELTHMVHDDHDDKFKALNSLLNKEAEELDWTRKCAHTLGGKAVMESDEEDSGSSDEEIGQVLGGKGGEFGRAIDPRAAAAAAAMRRDAEMRRREAEGQPTADVADDVIMDDSSGVPEPASEEEGVQGGAANVGDETPMEVEGNVERNVEGGIQTEGKRGGEEQLRAGQEADENGGVSKSTSIAEEASAAEGMQEDPVSISEPHSSADAEAASGGTVASAERNGETPVVLLEKDDGPTLERHEPDPDDPDNSLLESKHGEGIEGATSAGSPKQESENVGAGAQEEPMKLDASPVAPPETGPAPGPSEEAPRGSGLEATGGDAEWQRAQEAAAEASGRVQKAVADLKQQAGPEGAAVTLKTLAKILRNVMEHPGEGKYRRVRKTNAAFFERVGRFGAALEVLHAAGFREDGASDSMVLQRDDPGLLWLTCSLVEGSLA